MAYYSQKMILAKNWYKTYNDKFLIIVKVFKTWRYYLEDCKHKIFIFTNHNNLWQFMDTKTLSSGQIRLAYKVFWYYFQIDYCQSKANRAEDTVSRFSQQDDEKKANSWAKNTRVFHRLQSSLINASILGLNTTFSVFLL